MSIFSQIACCFIYDRYTVRQNCLIVMKQFCIEGSYGNSSTNQIQLKPILCSCWNQNGGEKRNIASSSYGLSGFNVFVRPYWNDA
jgi:hypothetical protein